MTVSGDLATIDLADLLQNIEAHSRTGNLTLVSDDGEARLFFRQGRVALLGRPDRTPLVDMLVSCGHLTAKRLATAKKKVRGSGRPVVELLVGARLLPLATLREIAEHRLSDDVANLIAAARGEFRFVEEAEPGPDFDPDETALKLALAVSPLVLEATRRVDDWAEIRKFVPSGRMHLRARGGATVPAGITDQELAATLLAALDGSRSAEEIIELAPDRRFQAHKMLSDFVRDRVVLPVRCDEMLEIAERFEPGGPERALTLVRRALDTEPHHVELLAAKARLARQLDQPALAVDAHKLLAHLHQQAERPDDARVELSAAQALAPEDTSLWQRSFELATAQGRDEDALAEGRQLVELYRRPGLHVRAKAVLEQLLAAHPDGNELHVEFARTCVDCGEARDAVRHLSGRAKQLVTRRQYDDARVLFEEILSIAPDHKEAELSIEMIDHQEFARRRARRRRMLQHTISGMAFAILGVFVGAEILARIAHVEVRSLISRERIIEQCQHEEALAIWRQLALENAWAPSTWFELPALIADLETRFEETHPSLTGR